MHDNNKKTTSHIFKGFTPIFINSAFRDHLLGVACILLASIIPLPELAKEMCGADEGATQTCILKNKNALF